MRGRLPGKVLFSGSALTSIPTFASFVPRQEMDSLQRQMEAHTVTMHESLSSWTQGDPVDSSAALGGHAHPGGDSERCSPNNASREGLGAEPTEHAHPEHV